jgi:glycosyltransferase involved in cell wall biosynthesis
MRILMLSQFYPPIIGGEERHVYNLSAGLIARGHNVAVVTIRHGQGPFFSEESGIRVYRIVSTIARLQRIFGRRERCHAPPFPDPEMMLALCRIIKQEEPEIVHAHNWMLHSFLPLKVCSDARLVVTLHDYSHVCVMKRVMRCGQICSEAELNDCFSCAYSHYGLKGPLITLTHRMVRENELRSVDLFLPVSLAVAQRSRLAEQRLRYRIIPNFVPDTLEQDCNQAHPLLDDLPHNGFLLFVGDIVFDKGVEVLLQAYAQLSCAVPLVLIGRTTNRFYVSLPPNTYMFDRWPHDVVLAAWQRCMFALVPSIWPDPCPTVAMEAMAMGKAVIGSRIGGLVDIVRENETGLLVPPADIDALKDAMQCLLNDPEKREAMGERARQSVVVMQNKAVIARIERVYREVLVR